MQNKTKQWKETSSMGSIGLPSARASSWRLFNESWPFAGFDALWSVGWKWQRDLAVHYLQLNWIFKSFEERGSVCVCVCVTFSPSPSSSTLTFFKSHTSSPFSLSTISATFSPSLSLSLSLSAAPSPRVPRLDPRAAQFRNSRSNPELRNPRARYSNSSCGFKISPLSFSGEP